MTTTINESEWKRQMKDHDIRILNAKLLMLELKNENLKNEMQTVIDQLTE